MASYYMTVAEAKAFRPPGSTAALSYANWTDAELQAVLERVEKWVESLCNDWWRAISATVFASGHNGFTLSLPTHGSYPHPIQSISEVQEVDFDKTTVINTYVKGTDFEYEAGEYVLRTCQTVPTRIRNAIGKAGVWPLGVKNIKIVGVFGHATCPADVLLAIKYLFIAESLGPAAARLSLGGVVTSQAWPDFTVSYGTSGKAIASSDMSGYPQVDRLLTPHVNMAGLFQVL